MNKRDNLKVDLDQLNKNVHKYKCIYNIVLISTILVITISIFIVTRFKQIDVLFGIFLSIIIPIVLGITSICIFYTKYYPSIREYNLRIKNELKNNLDNIEKELIEYIKQDQLFNTCTNRKLQEIYLYKLLTNSNNTINIKFNELLTKYFYITNQDNVRLTDEGVWLLHYLQNYREINKL